MSTIQQNYFKLDQPDIWHCLVRHYGMGHSNLEIGIFNPQTEAKRYLKFVGVEYFAGHLAWQGANFQIGSDEDCLAIHRETTGWSRQSDEDILLGAKLFYAQVTNANVSNLKIHIIAAGGFVADKSDLLGPY